MAKKKTAKTVAKKKPLKKASAQPEASRPAAKKVTPAPAARPSRENSKSSPPRSLTVAGKTPLKPAKGVPATREVAAAPQKAGKAGRSRADGIAVAPTLSQPAPVVKAPTRKLPSQELTRIRNFLAHKKQMISNHLQSELSELEKPEKRHRADLEEMASDTHDTDSLCEIMDIEATQIDQIDMALAKIENGTYGVCEDCGQEIPLPRLEALPFATQCIACKRRAEIQGQIAASDQAPAGF